MISLILVSAFVDRCWHYSQCSVVLKQKISIKNCPKADIR